ncbi:hypothetical protein BAG01nite_12320 [Brevibacillus agri]|uniref:Uncharacterized protein n=1 Tax=Brevibacillus agri TaxID=51101 RepID=A0ABQ0SMT2_9BACL|nr:hypothetical protein [Brevibacillus agri]MDN4095589.1 hypothetical protein [Brevibacillus agri]MED1646243.1 hypothetical protein [Brevibacillus agri]MED1656736.1 hypothetical protein [Brevibacillus agri]MED1689538.1 hypothetical protein [Brevibacillus agri]MED1692511.1 hypothetical protein [Brevibacillus agri]
MGNKFLIDLRMEKLEDVAKGILAIPSVTEAERKESDALLKKLVLNSKEKVK